MTWTRYFGFIPFVFGGILIIPIAFTVILILIPAVMLVGLLTLLDKISQWRIR